MTAQNAKMALASTFLLTWLTAEVSAQAPTTAPATVLPEPAPSAGALACPLPAPAVTSLPSGVIGVPLAPPAPRHDIEGRLIGYAPEFQQAPLGFSVSNHFRTHVLNGAAAKMTLYDFDFVGATATLNYRGKDRLQLVARMMSVYPFPLVIERTPRFPDLALARRQAVLQELADAHIAIPGDRIVVGVPRAFPLSGLESEAIYQTLLQQTTSAGARGAASGSGGGGTGGFAPSAGFSPTGSGGSR